MHLPLYWEARGRVDDVRSAFSYLSFIISIGEKRISGFISKMIPSGFSQPKQFMDELADQLIVLVVLDIYLLSSLSLL